MHAGERLSLEQIQALLEASEPLKFKGRNRKEVYDWVNQTVRGVGYGELKRKERGLVKQYIAKMTGLSRAQTTRMLGQYLRGEEIKPKLYRRHRFTKRYTRPDIELLAAVDEVHDTLSGPATLKLLQRACYDFGEKQYQRLAGCRWPNCTGCGKAAFTASDGFTMRRLDRPRWRSGYGAVRNLTVALDICE
jgi:hypothetical protein